MWFSGDKILFNELMCLCVALVNNILERSHFIIDASGLRWKKLRILNSCYVMSSLAMFSSHVKRSSTTTHHESLPS